MLFRCLDSVPNRMHRNGQGLLIQHRHHVHRIDSPSMLLQHPSNIGNHLEILLGHFPFRGDHARQGNGGGGLSFPFSLCLYEKLFSFRNGSRGGRISRNIVGVRAGWCKLTLPASYWENRFRLKLGFGP